MRAVVRVRPLLPFEVDAGHESCCQVSDERSILVRVGSGHQWRKYIFDACLPEDRAQKQVFQDSGVSYLLDEALAGYSATVLAYGQTGSGKTYTMMGRSVSSERSSPDEFSKKSDDALILRAARRLFRQMGEMSNMRVSVTASFAEIFNAPGAVNECICDLLNPEAGHLQVRFSQKHGFFISDLAVMECGTITDVRSVLEAGMQNRRVSAHALNRESSRTHALFTLHLDCEKFEEDGSSTRTYGKVTFVDLAGSERLKESLSEGNARKETQAINKSLFTLGQVISQLSQGRPERHVPYRNSKLTQLLQDSFGGSALCLMVTCISPAFAFAEETVNSLNYAQKAMNIQNTPILQLDEQQRVLYDLRTENATLRRELEGYKHRFGDLNGYVSDHGEREEPPRPLAAPPSAGGDSRASRGRSLPPDFSPQAPEAARPTPPSLASPNSARSSYRGEGGSYALAAVKRQQLKAPHVSSRSGKASKQLPPLPRGSTSGSAPLSRSPDAQARLPAPRSPCSWHSRRPSGEPGRSPEEPALSRDAREPFGLSTPTTPGSGAALVEEPSASRAPQIFRGSREITEEVSPLTAQQLDYLNHAKWSDWEVDFRSKPELHSVGRAGRHSDVHGHTGEDMRRHRREPEEVPAARPTSGPPSSSTSSSSGDNMSTASETPVQREELSSLGAERLAELPVAEEMSLAELNRKLASMAQDWRAHAREMPF